jgi:hypothetical protein
MTTLGHRERATSPLNARTEMHRRETAQQSEQCAVATYGVKSAKHYDIIYNSYSDKSTRKNGFLQVICNYNAFLIGSHLHIMPKLAIFVVLLIPRITMENLTL